MAGPRFSRYELVIFDCDGVLIDSEPIANRVLAEQLAAAGLRMSLDEAMTRFVGRTRDGCLRLAAELLGHGLPDGFAEAWDAALFDALGRELKAVDGVTDVLRKLQVPYCAASNSSPERMRVSLKAAGLLTFFEGRMFSATSVEKAKPAPDVFLHAAESMQAAPSRCVVIEDTPTGVQAGVAAGMTVFAYVGAVPQQAEKLKDRGAIPFDAMSKLTHLLSHADPR
jgi:HAD superfamily hydrolase (TIGR01509 family)